MSARRTLLAVALVGLSAVLAWGVLATGRQAPVPDNDGPAGERLERAPLDGDAFADLAVAMREAGHADAAAVLAMHRLAARRDPRDLRIRTWLADRHIAAGEYPQALAQLDVILRLSPDARKALPAAMAGWADDPAFADALVDTLAASPTWRREMIAALRQAVDRPGAGTVLAALRESGALREVEFNQWLESLIRAGKWGLAYSHWASSLDRAPGSALPMLYNGGFEQPPTNRGFDWRTGGTSGTYTEFDALPGASGQGARLVFLGRPVNGGDLEQVMHLPPGQWRLTFRARAVGLRSDQGLRWTLQCAGRSRPIATGERLDGTFEWKAFHLAFTVPAQGCEGQWLRLSNPAPRGSARMVSGELWVDDFSLGAAPMADQALH